MRICELRYKDVINCRDGMRLGYPCDIDFDIETGCILAIVIPGPCRLWGIIGHDNEYIIPANCIRQIGVDVILVDIKVEDCLHKCL